MASVPVVVTDRENGALSNESMSRAARAAAAGRLKAAPRARA
jgi:hypothetical protein